jgi:hypothetical protein
MTPVRLSAVFDTVASFLAADARPDADLLALFLRHGDERAFQALLTRHTSAVRAACRGWLRHEAAFDQAREAGFEAVAFDHHATVEEGHGRREERSVAVIYDPMGCLRAGRASGRWWRWCAGARWAGRARPRRTTTSAATRGRPWRWRG